MMMTTSTYPGSRSNHNMNYGLKEIQSKKDALVSLENALKKRVNEFKELCLKEGELTGHLPIDYPLQPREPIPQIRRRVNPSSGSGRSCSRTSSSSSSISNNNLNDINNLPPPCTSIRSHSTKLDPMQSQQQVVFAIPTNNTLPTTNSNLPSRPTSTHSTSSSISTASSNTRSAHNAIVNPQLSSNLSIRNSTAPTRTNQQSTNNNNSTHYCNSNILHYTDQVVHNQLNNHRPIRYDQSMLPNHFKRPFNIAPTATFDSDTLGLMRASSTASSSSSSGSGTSSVLSAPPAVSNSTHISNGLNMNLHGRSCSESITSDPTINSLGSNAHSRPKSQDMLLRQHLFNNQMAYLHTNPNVPPTRPPREQSIHGNRRIPSSTDTVDGNLSKQQQPLQPAPAPPSQPSENRSSLVNTHQHQRDVKPLQHFNINGSTNFQPFLEEETKPFQMSDFYKYSSKYRQKVSDPQKTTRQLQEDVMKKNSLKYSSCDDQIQALPKLFEKSGQKLIEATAKAIAGNPGLAEKLNNILPNNHKSDNRY